MKIKTHYKITLIFTLMTAILLSTGYLYLNSNLKTHTRQNIRAELKKKTALAKYILEKNTGQNPISRLDEIADDIGQNLQLRATIIGVDGTVLGDSELDGDALHTLENHINRPEVQEAMRAGIGESQRFSTTLNQNMLYMAMLFNSAEAEGMIRLALPLAEMQKLSDRVKDIIGVSLFAVFLLSILINYGASAWISKPIQGMSKAAKRIAEGDFSKINTLSLDGEIADLGHAFNSMSQELSARIKDMGLSRSRLEAVLLSMFEGVLVVDATGSILLMNQALRDFFHITMDVSGKNAIEVIRNIDIQKIIDAVLQSDLGLDPTEISILSPEEKILSVYATPVISPHGQEGAILVFHDLSNVKRLEKIRQDFVANVSHELKTPIASIQGYAETLLDGALEDQANAKDFIGVIYHESERLAQLIDDLLSLSKIESGKLNMSLKPTKLPPIIQKVITSMDIQAERKSINISMALPEDLPLVMADGTRITQVLFNLIDNALKYSPENSRVLISAVNKNGNLEVAVSDTGIGIPEEDLPRIFERFYRVDKGRSRALGGTGLGLSIVKHIVKAHNGEISIQSTLGKGTTFIFTLPKAH